MKGRLFNVLAGVSLVLLVASLAWWVCSYWIALTFLHRGQTTSFVIATYPAIFEVTCTDQPFFIQGFRANQTHDEYPMRFWLKPDSISVAGRRVDRNWLGFMYASWTQQQGPGMPPCNFTEIAIPFWFISLCAGVYPAVRVRRAIRTRRATQQRGRCIICGYDLRATPERCPECGTVAGSVSG